MGGRSGVELVGVVAVWGRRPATLGLCLALAACNFPGDGDEEAVARPKAWSAPQTLATGDIGAPTVTATNDGGALVAWGKPFEPVLEQAEQGPPSFVARFRRGQGWQAPEPVGVSGQIMQDHDFRIVANDAGDVLVAWEQIDMGPNARAPRVNRFAPRQGWGGVTSPDVNRGVDGWQLVLDATGHATLVWRSAATGRLTSAESDRATAWSVPFDHGVPSRFHALAAGPDGALVLAFSGTDSRGWFGSWASHKTPGGPWSTPQLIGVLRPEVGTFCKPRRCAQDDENIVMAHNGRGDVAVAWEAFDPYTELIRVWANVFRAGTGWSGPVAVGDAPWSVNVRVLPVVTIDDDARVAVLWRSVQPDSRSRVDLWMAVRSAAGSWSPAAIQERLAGTMGYGSLSVVAAPAGQLFLAWYEAGALAASWDPADGWSAARLFTAKDDPAAESMGNASIAVDKSGRATLVWIDHGSSSGTWRSAIHAARFE